MTLRERIGVGALAAATVLGHLAATPVRDTVVGPLLVLDHLYALVLVACLAAVCIAIGVRVLRAMFVATWSAIETIALAMALGTAVLATTFLAVGAVVGVRGWMFATILSAAVIVCRAELVAVPAHVGAAWREWRASSGVGATLAMALIAGTLLLLALAPPGDTDSLNYHLRIPAQFLERGRIHLPDDNLHVAWVGLAHFLYLPLLAAGAAAAPALLNVVFAILLAAALGAAAARLAPRPAAGLAPIVLWGSPIVLLVASTPKIDVTFAFYLFLAHYLLVRAMLSRERRWLVLSAVLCGSAVGSKLLALPYLASLAPVVWLAVRGMGRREAARQVAAFALIAAAAALPWLVKNWLLVGAPFYPELSKPIMPPWLAELHGSTALPAGLDPGSLAPLREVRARFNVVDWFVAPGRLTPESEGRFYHANMLFVLVLLSLPLLRRRALAAFVIPALVYIGIAIALGTRVNLRYLIPVIPALTLATAWVAAWLLERVKHRGARRTATIAIGLVALVGPARAAADKFALRAPVAHAAGLASRRDYRLTSRDIEIAPYARLTDRVNALVPPDARVLLLFEPRGYGFRANALQDNVMTNWVLLEPVVAAPRCLESSRITHVLVGTSTLTYFIGRGFDPRVIHWDRFPAFAERCLVLIEETPAASLYAVRSNAR